MASMDLYDIVEAASSHIKEGALILHRSMKEHPKFRVYKKFCYDLYHVKDNAVKNLILSYKETRNTPADDLSKMWSECDRLYLSKFMKWLTEDEFKSMMK